LDKGLISRIYKALQKLNAKRKNNPTNKWAYELDSSQNKYIKKCSTPLPIKEV
jgi:hypothetical protein